MEYISFDRQFTSNHDSAFDREILSTNMAGAYSASTIVGCNTRKYHGTLVVPVPEIGRENFVLLSSCAETVIQHQTPFHLDAREFADGTIAPKGYKYIRRFTYSNVATTIYRIGGVILQKELLLVLGENRVLIKYTLLDAHSRTTLQLRPFPAFRSVHALTHENYAINKECQQVENGVAFQYYDGYPKLVMQCNVKATWHDEGYWYKNIFYRKEAEHGLEATEDLFTPGYFEVEIKKGQSIVFTAGTSEISPRRLRTLFDAEQKHRLSRADFKSTLKAAALQFMYKTDDESYLIAGYPWFDCDAAAEFIALPGETLATGYIFDFKAVMQTAEKAIRAFFDGDSRSTRLSGLERPDALLWAVWAIQQYALKEGFDDARHLYGALVCDIINFIRHQKHPNLFVHNNGLVYTNGSDAPASWMTALKNGRPALPRSGYLVELNALWYNALKFGAEILAAEGIENQSQMLDYQAELMSRSFVETFWNGYYLYDYVINDYKSTDVRSNQIFAVSLPFSPLPKPMQKAVVDIAARELLTPKGLRSLSPKSAPFRPLYVEDHDIADRNFYNGPVWPWMTAAFVEAYLKVYKQSGASFASRTLSALEQEMRELTLGSLSELYDANPPFRGHGAMSYAPSVAETLRAFEIIEKSKTVNS